MTLTGWGVLLGLLLVAAIVVAAIALIIRFVIRHRRGYDLALSWPEAHARGGNSGVADQVKRKFWAPGAPRQSPPSETGGLGRADATLPVRGWCTG
jgi:hypothetical protein